MGHEGGSEHAEFLEGATVERDLISGEPEPLDEIAGLLGTESREGSGLEVVNDETLLARRCVAYERSQMLPKRLPAAFLEMPEGRSEVRGNRGSSAQAESAALLLDEGPNIAAVPADGVAECRDPRKRATALVGPDRC